MLKSLMRSGRYKLVFALVLASGATVAGSRLLAPKSLIDPDVEVAQAASSDDSGGSIVQRAKATGYERMPDAERLALYEAFAAWTSLDHAGAPATEHADLADQIRGTMVMCEDGLQVPDDVLDKLADRVASFALARAGDPERYLAWVQESGREWASPDSKTWRTHGSFTRAQFGREPEPTQPERELLESLTYRDAQCDQRWASLGIESGGGMCALAIALDESMIDHWNFVLDCMPLPQIDMLFGRGSHGLAMSVPSTTPARLIRRAGRHGVLLAQTIYAVQTQGGHFGGWRANWAYDARSDRWYLLESFVRFPTAIKYDLGIDRSKCGKGISMVY
ncbi:MAG: hypothetical protein AAGG07_07090 [Planctomycetota bacterium]